MRVWVPMGKASSLLDLILLHSNKLETVFKKPKQAVSLPLTTWNEIASSFCSLTSYKGGDCVETPGRNASLKIYLVFWILKRERDGEREKEKDKGRKKEREGEKERKGEKKKEVMLWDCYQKKQSKLNTITVVIQISTGIPLFLFKFILCEQGNISWFHIFM